jgi:hypothetical protein
MGKKKKQDRPSTSRRIIRQHELELYALANTMVEGTDAACALICGAYIENAMGGLLEKAMIDDEKANGENGLLNDPRGMLSSAGARTDMAYCLGLIDRTTYNNLHFPRFSWMSRSVS